jgi:uncharacterized protein YjbI with pentapeptide repeats
MGIVMSGCDRRISWLWLGVKRCLAIVLLGLGLVGGGCLGLWVPPAIAVDYNREMLEGMDFSNRDMTDASFTKANLREANLSGANLQGVSFFAANLEDANLTGADMTNATLDSARISSANLTNAILVGAFAFNAKFERSIVDGADFTDVQMREDTRVLLCKVAKGTNPVTHQVTRETLMCDD